MAGSCCRYQRYSCLGLNCVFPRCWLPSVLPESGYVMAGTQLALIERHNQLNSFSTGMKGAARKQSFKRLSNRGILLCLQTALSLRLEVRKYVNLERMVSYGEVSASRDPATKGFHSNMVAI